MDNCLIIYHANCYDGFTSAWIAKGALGMENLRPELYPATYGEDPPDVRGRSVWVLDFSYPRSVMEQMNEDALGLTVLDHHKTAEADCRGLDFCTFDMNRSGCGMTWDHFFGGTRPAFVDHVEDRDLWRFTFDDTASVHAYIASLPMTLEAWDDLANMPIHEVAENGTAIRMYIDNYCLKAAREARVTTWCGVNCATINVPYQNASELAGVLLSRHPDCMFSAAWFQRADGRIQFSLRSRSGFDVSEIATRYGGGGHAQASGFDLDADAAFSIIQDGVPK